MIANLVILAGAGGVASWFVAGRVRGYALKRSLLDRPNERSSHTVPTPRGGGIAIAAVTITGIIVAAAIGVLTAPLAIALGGGGAVIAWIGWLDDQRGLSPFARLLTHTLAACWALYWLGGLPRLRLGPDSVALGGLGFALAVVGIVWLTNLYNFMDGIDGLAAGEAALVGAVGGAMLARAGQPGIAFVAWLIAFSSVGFLIWNWPPARLFMGDVGSAFIGFLFAVLAVASETAGAVPLLGWVILLGAFVFDATVTLARRAAHGEQWYAAHRSHAYQRATQHARGHARVTSAVLALGVALAALAWAGWVWPVVLLPAVATGIVMLAIAYRAVERSRPMYASSRPIDASGSR